MKSIIAKALPLMTAALFLGGGVAQASDVVEVQVPFPFSVHQYQLPAGHYRIQRDPENLSLVLIEGDRGTRAECAVIVEPADGRDPAAPKPSVTFTPTDHGYALKSVWTDSTDGETVGLAGVDATSARQHRGH
jgi:hypothetical protein